MNDEFMTLLLAFGGIAFGSCKAGWAWNLELEIMIFLYAYADPI
jgi:hypothetical protein